MASRSDPPYTLISFAVTAAVIFAVVMRIQRNRARWICREAKFYMNRSEGQSDDDAMANAEDVCGKPGPLTGPMTPPDEDT